MTYELPKVPRDSFVVLRSDGREETHPFPVQHGTPRLKRLAEMLGYDTFDIVTLTRRGRAAHLVMVVNDKGYESEAVERTPGYTELVAKRARFPINAKATDLYHAVCLPGTKHQIVGDVALLHDDD